MLGDDPRMTFAAAGRVAPHRGPFVTPHFGRQNDRSACFRQRARASLTGAGLFDTSVGTLLDLVHAGTRAGDVGLMCHDPAWFGVIGGDGRSG